MSRFYLILEVRWLLVFVLIALITAVGFATVTSGIIYGVKGFAPLDPQTRDALRIIWFFWLDIGYGVGIITALLVSLGQVFYRCIAGYRLSLINCKEERIEALALRPYFKVWRKWFFTLIWVNAAQAVVLIAIHKLLYGGGVWIGWFNPWGITPMILLSGAAALVIVVRSGKRLRVEPCSL
ncbi:MAG: hypothetical protein PHW64_09050 [Sulfuricurvum sp.]|nr:hypothetical protein [Sulfuricurvum sp.]